MAHWSDRYLGLPWSEGFDCGALVERVRREVFGHEISLTPERRPGPWGRNAQIRDEVNTRAARTVAPADGDIAILVCKGRAQHVGLYCLIAGEPWVLHNGEGTGTVRRRVRDLARWGYTLEGCYRWT